MMQRMTARAVASALIFTLTYSPILGSFTNTVVAAQTVQDSTTTYTYDPLGNVKEITNPLSKVTKLDYDELNRIKQEQQPPAAVGGAAPVVKYTYDGLDQVNTVTDPRNLVTTYVNDGLGNQGTLSSPDTGASGKTYDAAGNMLTSTDAMKKVTTYTYDALNRVKSIKYATLAATVFEYDGGPNGAPSDVGHLTKMTDAAGVTTYAYNQRGNLITQTQSIFSADGPDVRVTNYGYGTTGASASKLMSMTYPSGNRIAYDYDAGGLVQSLTLHAPDGTSTVLLKEIGYAPFGPAQSWTWGNDSSAAPSRYARTFDLDGRVVTYPLGNLAKKGLVRTVAYDAASRIKAYTHTAAVNASPLPSAYDQTFDYDDLDRLTSVVTPTGTQGYAYDLNGNRSQVKYGANSYTYTINPKSNVLDATAGPLPARSFAHDPNGSLTKDQPTTYVYRDDGRLNSMSKSATENAAYFYNGLGQRVSKRSTVAVGGTNMYVYDTAGHTIGEYIAKGAALEETVYLGDQPVAVLQPKGAGTAAYYVYADHINTPRVITNATDNAMVWRWDNADPFGVGAPNENLAGGSAFVYNLRFPGQLFDKETNTHYNMFRDYDPQTGRYVQSDLIGLGGGLNTYAYGLGNPISNTDPKGLFVPLVIAGVCAAGGCEAIFAAAAAGAVWWGATHQPMASSSDSSLQEAIEREANRREYKSYCDDPPPPSGNACDDAQNELKSAQRCESARDANTAKWWKNKDDVHSPELAVNLTNRIERAKRSVKQYCPSMCTN